MFKLNLKKKTEKNKRKPLKIIYRGTKLIKIY